MSPWRDVLDRAEGYPCEFSNAGDVFTFFHNRGFTLETLRTVPGLNLNEFVFRAPAGDCRIEHETNGLSRCRQGCNLRQQHPCALSFI
jgi:hypothetical protein